MTAEGTEDIVERLRDQCCRLGHDDHGHTDCWLFGRAAAEIERLREETTTLRERTTPPHPMTFIPGHVGDPAFEPGPTDPEPSSAVEECGVTTRPAIRRAEQVLADMGVTEVPVPVEAVAHQFGLNVVFQDLPRDTSAVIVRTSDGRRVIGINGGHSDTRQRFSIAHEIGHALLHLPADPPASGDAVVDKPIEVLFRDGIAAQGVDKREIEANAFAAELLMPAKGLRERFRRLIQSSGSRSTDALIRDLAATYEVSPQAMAYRLANLNLIDPT